MAVEITDYVARIADEEVDTVEICPEYRDFMVFGTYALVGEKKEYEAQIRKGSIQVLPVSTTFKPSYAGMLLPRLAKHTFSAAVLDLRFHPLDHTLIGVATSDAKLHFFRFIVRGDVHERRVITEFLPLGSVVVAEADEYGLIPLVTQFQWLPFIKSTGDPVNSMLRVVITITLSSHEAKLVKAQIPNVTGSDDHQLSPEVDPISADTADIHLHDLEAWTTNMLLLPNVEEDEKCLFFSGADDSKLMTSIVELDLTGHNPSPIINSPLHLWTDRSTHGAGVTAILPIPSPSSLPIIPILTGSYDEYIRIYELDTSNNYRRKMVCDLKLHGGVWRLKLMDCYTSISSPSVSTTHYLILASCMHAGVKILRITYNSNEKWKIDVEAEFTKGHETLVYACDFRREDIDKQNENENDMKSIDGEERENVKYTVVSTSFYDKQICVWEFVDTQKPKIEQ